VTEAQPTYRRLGPYLLVHRKGGGAMGAVDIALKANIEGGELCVLKRMREDGGVPDQRERFRREAAIALRLRHDAIAQTLRVEEIDGEPCLAQEFVEGVDLGRLLKRSSGKHLPISTAAYIVREVARALAYAHDLGELGIVHRDVTPENIMLAYSGEVKLIDFGIARTKVDATLTSLGMVIGRREYVAPEIWEGAKADRRADVYALGLVLWELLVGQRVAETAEAKRPQAVLDPCPLRDEIPGELGAITARALAAEPGARFQTAAELRDALAAFVPPGSNPRADLASLLAFYFNVERDRQFLTDEVDEARRFLRRELSERRRPASRRTVWAIGALVAAVAGAGALAASRRGPARPARVGEVAARPAALRQPPPVAPAESGAPRAGETPKVQRAVAAVAAPRRSRVGDAPADVATGAHEATSAADLLLDAQERWERGDVEGGLALARRASSAGAGAPAHVLLGSIYMATKRPADAERELAKAAKMSPGDQEIERLLAAVRAARAEHGNE